MTQHAVSPEKQASTAASSSNPLQRKCACGAAAQGLSRECEDCQRKQGIGMPPSAALIASNADADTDPRRALKAQTPVAAAALNAIQASRGIPLRAGVRSEFEQRFAHDLSAIRIHSNAQGDRAAGMVAAHAVALGNDIAFKSGHFAPDTTSGRRLLAHELAHTIQQRHANHRSPVRISTVADRAEQEAGMAADAVLAGKRPRGLSRMPLTLARGLGDEDKPKLPRSAGLTEAEWKKIKKARAYFNLPERPTKAKPTIVGVIVTDRGEELFVKSGEHGGPWGGTQRGGIPRGPKEGFTGGGNSQGNIATHIEGHTAAIMHQRGIEKATLLIEEAPCRICDSTQGWNAETGDWTDPKRRRTSPGVSQVIPPGSKLTIVDPETTGHYFSDKPAPRASAARIPEEPEAKTRPKSMNPAPEAGKPPGKATVRPPGGKLPGALPKAIPSLPKGTTTPKLSPKPSATGAARMGPRVLRGVGNIALDLSMLLATVIFELVVAPKIRSLQQQLQQFIDELEADRRKRLEAKIQEKFDIYESKHIGRIVKSCYLGQLRELEKAGKTAYVNVDVAVSFEDTSNRFQLFEETPPESFFDLEFYDVDLKNVVVSDTPVPEAVGGLQRCESCGAMGRDKSFMGNNPLWQQTVSFSFIAPKASEIAHEFDEEPELSECVASIVCFIASACYGTPFAQEVEILRRVRDGILLPTRIGRAFVRTYYRLSPPIAYWLSQRSWARRLVREWLVAPLARSAQALGLDRGKHHYFDISGSQHEPAVDD